MHPVQATAVAARLILLGALLAASGKTAARDDGDPAAKDDPPGIDEAALEASGAVIGNITLVRDNVFDLSQPGENSPFYQLANRLHRVTQDAVIRSQLLIEPGDPYSARLLEESARILRRNRYLFDAKVTPTSVHDGEVDITVWTRDVWTLMPDISFSRTGGEDKWRIGAIESNLLGWGTRIKLSHEENVDRNITSFELSDQNLFRSRTQLRLSLADSSDGDIARLAVQRPFFALDSRWAAGVDISSANFEQRFFELGDEAAEYRQESDYYTAFAGWSQGLKNGWVTRWTSGIVFDEDRFSEALDPEFPTLLPANRRLIYPFIGFEMIEDDFKTAANREQFERTEDFLLGRRFSASVGYASESFDSDRESVLYNASFSRGFGSIDKRALLLSSDVSGRVDDGEARNTLFRLNLRYYNQRSKKRLFVMSASGAAGSDLDLDNLQELGGSTGLRGYPLRYQTGSSRALFSVEERYFTDWYPFRIVRVGLAAFADAGRTWGRSALGNPSQGWLTNVGLGLRLAPTRAGSREIVHIDLAFPLNGDDSIDNFQLILESKGSF